MDVHVSADLVIPGQELTWRFTRSGGPGGQHVNTSDTRVEVSWNIHTSKVLSESQRSRLIAGLGGRLTGEVITVSASTHRSQIRNRHQAAEKLAALIRTALAPPAPRRRPTKPTRGSLRRATEAKRHRSEIKRLRRRPQAD